MTSEIVKILVDKLKYNFGGHIHMDYDERGIQFHIKDFKKWEELKNKYSREELEKYFLEWLVWKYPKDISNISMIWFDKRPNLTVYHNKNNKFIISTKINY